MTVKLLVVQGKAQGKSLVFPVGEYVFGRGAECHIRPNSDWVSRQHCLLRVTEEALYLRDLGSRNGTLVNGERLVNERRLCPGDHLQVGPLVFEVQVHRPQAETDVFQLGTAEMEKVSARRAAEPTAERPATPVDDPAVHTPS